MNIEEIKEYCKRFESRHWEIDIYLYNGEATIVRFYDRKRPIEVCVSGVVGNDIYRDEQVKEEIGIIYSSFKNMWNMLYFYLGDKYMPEGEE